MRPSAISVGSAGALAAVLALSLGACRLEPPDPASQAAAILHKHPSDFTDQLVSLDALAMREVQALGLSSGTTSARPLLAESLYAYTLRLRPALAAVKAVDAADPAAASVADSLRIAILNAFLFDTLGIRPLLDSAPLASSVPSLILKEKRASCVGLVLLYLALAQSLDLPMAPVFLPGHLFVRYRPEGRPARNIETLRGGIARTDSFYRETFSLGKRPWYSLSDGQPEQALSALVFNLGNARREYGDLNSAAEEYRLVVEAIPGYPEALGNQAVCFLAERDRTRARVGFLQALAGDSLAEPALRNLALMEGTGPHPE